MMPSNKRMTHCRTSLLEYHMWIMNKDYFFEKQDEKVYLHDQISIHSSTSNNKKFVKSLQGHNALINCTFQSKTKKIQTLYISFLNK